MTPEEFCRKWKLSRPQLAMLLGISQVTVNHWLSAKSQREPMPDVLRRLDEYDAIATAMLDLAERFPLLWEAVQSRLDGSDPPDQV